jgi:hypothetical protein
MVLSCYREIVYADSDMNCVEALCRPIILESIMISIVT